MRLVGDIGGTNSRLALSQAGDILDHTIQSFLNAQWDDLYAVISYFLAQNSFAKPTEIVIAVAGPVQGGRARLTNRDWRVEEDQLKSNFGVTAAHLLNDLTALGYAVPKLKTSQRKCVAEGVPHSSTHAQSIVVGVGTGFNVSPVLESYGSVFCSSVEAGHVGMPQEIGNSLCKIGVPRDRFPTVETLFSGRGFTTFCQAVSGHSQIEGQDIISAYQRGGKDTLTSAVDLYAGLLGALLRDVSLAYLPYNGIYLAGSVARSVIATAPQACIDVLRRPYDIQAFNDPPVWVIQDDLAALSGCNDFVFQR